MKRSKEPSWLTFTEILALHETLLALFGGPPGIRDNGLLESALDRPQNHHVYEKADIFTLAAMYADGIVNNHPFIDGNKRTGFLAAALFLETNGYRFNASEEDAVLETLGLAAKKLSTADYAEWLRKSSTKA